MVELARRVALKTKTRKAQQPSYDPYASSGIHDSGGSVGPLPVKVVSVLDLTEDVDRSVFDTRLTAHAHGELEPRSHDDVRLAATEPISPLGAVGGGGVARKQTVFRMILEFLIEGFAQYGASIYAAGYNVPEISAYQHGRTAAQHGEHIQACPFDAGTPEWREWRKGFCDEPVTSLK